MQPIIPMKFAGYVAWILLCQVCKFGEKIYYNSGDIEFFLGDYFFWRALYIYYLRCRLASGEGIVSLLVRLSRSVCVRRISLGGEDNALYPVLSCSYSDAELI